MSTLIHIAFSTLETSVAVKSLDFAKLIPPKHLHPMLKSVEDEGLGTLRDGIEFWAVSTECGSPELQPSAPTEVRSHAMPTALQIFSMSITAHCCRGTLQAVVAPARIKKLLV